VSGPEYSAEDPYASPHSVLLGMLSADWDAEAQVATMRFKVRREVTTWRGGVQGGLVAGFLDDVMGYAYIGHTDGAAAPLNLEISMSLLRLIPEGAVVTAKGRVVKGGRRVIFLEAELLDEDGGLYARATSTAIPTPRPTPTETGMG
jgi:uncharacterized protein (TIGR00369 family)